MFLLPLRHESPVIPRRERTETSTSFKMNPEDLERVTHQDEVYTVVNKQFKQAQREADKSKQEPPRPRPKLRPSRSIDQIDGGGGMSQPGGNRPPKPAVPPHKGRVTSHIQQGGAGVGGWRGNGAAVAGNYSQPFLPPSSHLPPPQIIKKQQSADHPFITQATPISARPPSAPLLDTKYDIDYDEIDESESPPPPPVSEGNFPGYQDRNGKQQRKQEDVPGKLAPQPQPRSKPVPAARPMIDKNKENKKQELHLKYKRIQDNLIRKQDASEGQNPRGHGQSKVGVASTPTSGEGNMSRGNGVDHRKYSNFSKGGGNPDESKLKHRPSYAEIDPDRGITVEEFQGEGEEGALWGLVRYPGAKKGVRPSGPSSGMGGAVAAAVAAMSMQQQQPPKQQQSHQQHQHQGKKEDSLRRSSSSSNLTGSDFYSNLTDLELNSASRDNQLAPGNKADSLGKKSHSFSEGLDKLVFPATSNSR